LRQLLRQTTQRPRQPQVPSSHFCSCRATLPTQRRPPLCRSTSTAEQLPPPVRPAAVAGNRSPAAPEVEAGPGRPARATSWRHNFKSTSDIRWDDIRQQQIIQLLSMILRFE
jgi:hypothetical protein